MIKINLIIFVTILIISSASGNPLASSSANFLEVIAFRNLGSYRGFTDDGVEYHKTYYISKYIWASWAEASSFCKSYDLEFLTLETAEEAAAFINFADTNTYLKSLTNAYYYVDGFSMTPYSRTEWFWSTTDKKVSFNIIWLPSHPMDRNCLCLIKSSGRFYLYDTLCNGNAGFACQKTKILTPQAEN